MTDEPRKAYPSHVIDAEWAFEAVTRDLRRRLRRREGRDPESSAAAFDSRTPQGTPGSGGRAAYDGDHERLATTLAGLHFVAYARVMFERLVDALICSS